MSEAKFTKGPWKIEYDEEYGTHTIRMGSALENKGNFEPQHEIEYEHGCWFEEDEEEDYPANRQAAEAEANARLIASAPDMYEALEIIIDPLIYLQKKAKEEGKELDVNYALRVVDDISFLRGFAWKALAKARGENQDATD